MTQEAWESDVMPSSVCQDLMDRADLVHGDRERCGLIRIDQDRRWHILEVSNRSNFKDEFVMSAEDLGPLWNLYEDQIVGVWHTHPRGDMRPSEKDVKWSPLDLRYWTVTQRGVQEYDMQQVPPKVLHHHGTLG